jgi:hypothetical protein
VRAFPFVAAVRGVLTVEGWNASMEVRSLIFCKEKVIGFVHHVVVTDQ